MQSKQPLSKVKRHLKGNTFYISMRASQHFKSQLLSSIAWCFLLLSTFLIVSCDGNRVFDEYKSIGDSWEKDTSFIFKFQQPDSTNKYNLFVNLRNNNEYEYQNLFLIVRMNFPNGKVVADTLEYAMATPDGKWLGTGFTDTKENKLWYKENVSFPQEGIYEVSIEQAMRKINEPNGIPKLKGISEIGFRIEKIAE